MKTDNSKLKNRREGIQPSDQTVDTDVAHPGGQDRRRLPHEHDESHDSQPTKGTNEHIKQAARDVSQGLRDTERRGVPSDVPGPGADPEKSPGADVPTAAKPRSRGKG